MCIRDRVYACLHIGVLVVLVVFGGVTCIGMKTQNTMSLRDTAFSVLRLNTWFWGDTSPSCGYSCFSLLVVLECAQHCIRVKTQNTMSLRDLAFCDFREHPGFRVFAVMDNHALEVLFSPWFSMVLGCASPTTTIGASPEEVLGRGCRFRNSVLESENRKCACALSVLRFSVFGAQPVFVFLVVLGNDAQTMIYTHACISLFYCV